MEQLKIQIKETLKHEIEKYLKTKNDIELRMILGIIEEINDKIMKELKVRRQLRMMRKIKKEIENEYGSK